MYLAVNSDQATGIALGDKQIDEDQEPSVDMAEADQPSVQINEDQEPSVDMAEADRPSVDTGFAADTWHKRNLPKREEMFARGQRRGNHQKQGCGGRTLNYAIPVLTGAERILIYFILSSVQVFLRTYYSVICS
jgi:hypothetical protein